jgi:hypothetical protein
MPLELNGACMCNLTCALVLKKGIRVSLPDPDTRAMPVTVEYLVLIDKTSTFCENAESFTSLLNVDSSINIRGGELTFQKRSRYAYAITSGEIDSKSQRYFHVKIAASDCDTQETLDEFSAMLKKIRSAMSTLGGVPETLWDDISFHYSKIAYDVIYRVENLMRKLIANFMLVTVGAGWVKESAPKQVKEVIGKSKRKEYINILHTLDFIHLADLLLRPYSVATHDDIYSQLEDAKTIEELAAIKALIPQSNWRRYFSKIVDCKDEYLNTRWKDLYDLRCKVAHNSLVDKSDYEQINKIAGELVGKLEDALAKLPQVVVPQMEINQVTENALSDLRQVCPVCGSRNTLIVRVSPLGPGSIANPHHQCEKCGHRFIAAERTPLAGMNPMIGSMNPMMGSMNPMMIQMMQMMNQMSGGMGMTPGLTPTIPQPLEEEEDDDDDDEGEGI